MKIGQETTKRPLENAESIPKGKKIKVEIPDEIWLKIIGFLDSQDVFCRLALVCKRFKSLTSDPTAIKRLLINHIKVQKKDSSKFRKLLKRNRNMVDFTLVRACLKTAINVIPIVLKSSPKLKSLKILNHMNCKCIGQMDILVECIKTHQPDLENLELNFVNYDSQAMTEICTLKKLKSLKILNQKGYLQPEHIYHLAMNCENLENIYLENRFHHVERNSIGMLWNYLIGQRSKTLKSIHVDVDLGDYSIIGYPFIEMENLKLCQDMEEISIRFDTKHLTMLSELPKLKKIVWFGFLSSEDLIPCFQSMNLSSLKYISFRRIHDLDSVRFWTKFSMMNFPVLERLYFHRKGLDKPLKQNFVQNFLNNTPYLKSIQFGGCLANNLTDKFLFDVFKNSNIFVIIGDSLKQLKMEDYFKSRSTALFQKYQLMKEEFSKWCEDTDLY